VNPEERAEHELRRKIEHAIYDAGFSEARIRFLREGLSRLGPRALRELLSILRDLDERGKVRDPETKQARFW
jgi:hypothetical protein